MTPLLQEIINVLAFVMGAQLLSIALNMNGEITPGAYLLADLAIVLFIVIMRSKEKHLPPWRK